MTGGIERAPITPESDKIFRDNLVAIIPSLRSFARGLCGNRDLADDLAQDENRRSNQQQIPVAAAEDCLSSPIRFRLR